MQETSEQLCQEDRHRQADVIDRTITKMKQAKVSGFREIDFDMSNWFVRNTAYACGTTACIAGWVVYANSNLEIPDLIEVGLGKDGNIPERARQLLRINKDQASALFFAWDDSWSDLSLPNITVDHAILVLEHLQETGEVTWSVIDDLVELAASE